MLPFGLALLYLGLYTVSGITFGDADAEVGDFDADADADVHLDADTEVDHDFHGPNIDADADANHDLDSDGDADSAIADDQSADSAPAIHWLGIGQVPLSITLMVLLMLWGWSGFVTNYLLAPHMARAWHVALCTAR